MAPGLDGVINVMVIADAVMNGVMPRGRLAPSLLPELGTPGLRVVGATIGGVTTAPTYWWGMSVGAIPIGGGHRLGWPREHDATPGSRALGLLLEGNVKKLHCLVQPLIGLQVRHVRYILQPAGGDHHVVGRSREV